MWLLAWPGWDSPGAPSCGRRGQPGAEESPVGCAASAREAALGGALRRCVFVCVLGLAEGGPWACECVTVEQLIQFLSVLVLCSP